MMVCFGFFLGSVPEKGRGKKNIGEVVKIQKIKSSMKGKVRKKSIVVKTVI